MSNPDDTKTAATTELPCPRCGGVMEKGYIAGHWSRLRWCESDRTKTIFAGTPLKKKRDWINAPSITASRCRRCQIGVFEYDNP